MPWIHYHVGNAGRVKACCVSNTQYGNLNTQSFSEIWNGEAIQELRNKFAAGEKDSRCKVCYQLEQSGAKSIRQETHEKFGEDFDPNNKLPIYFDIRFSNACNFACRTCWHGASSAWFPEAKLMKRNLGEFALLQNITNFDQFIQQTGEALLLAKEIYFAGGEPLATKEHYLLLDWLVKNKATKMRLRYNTNFSQLKMGAYNVLDFWKHFPDVEVLSSIDAHGELGAYIRKGFSWEQFKSNRALLREYKNIRFLIAPTISVFSIQNLPALYQTCLMEQIIEADGIYINILDRPLHYNTKALPVKYKQKVVSQYQEFYNWALKKQIPHSVIEKFNECECFMLSEDLSKQWPNFQKETNLLDEMRGEDIEEHLLF